jgi:hypothetical protein
MHSSKLIFYSNKITSGEIDQVWTKLHEDGPKYRQGDGHVTTYNIEKEKGNQRSSPEGGGIRGKKAISSSAPWFWHAAKDAVEAGGSIAYHSHSLPISNSLGKTLAAAPGCT